MIEKIISILKEVRGKTQQLLFRRARNSLIGDTSSSDRTVLEKVSRQEQSNFWKDYRSLFRHWESIRHRENMPEVLDENFFLLDWHLNQLTAEMPRHTFTLLNENGFIRLNWWVVSDEDKIIATTQELYSQGLHGDFRGKGAETFQQLEMLLQLLSTLTGYTIHDYVNLNVGSERLISQLQGYEYVSQKNTPQLQSANHLNLRRFEHLIESFQNTVKQVRVKIYGLSKVLCWFLSLFRCQKVSYQYAAFC